MNNGNRKPSHARLVFHIEQRAVDIEAIGVRTVENDHLLMVYSTLVHDAHHGDIVRIVTQTNVLNIGHDNVNTCHCSRIGNASFGSVERENGHTRLFVHATGHVFACIGLAAETVFGRENGYYVHAMTQQQVEGHEVRAVGLHNNSCLV